MYLDLLGGYRGFPKLLLLVLEALLLCIILIIKAYGLVLEHWILLNWFGLVCSGVCMQIIIVGTCILEITTKIRTQRGQGGC